MIFGQKTQSILGMNARQLLYVNKLNSRSSRKFADDKLFSKQFLESRNIGVAKLYHVVKNHRQLTDDFFDGLPNAFVIKPNKGYAGGGIMVITEKKGKYWVTISGKKIDHETMYLHCMDILEGKYAISGTYDSVIFEEVLETHPDFRLLTQVGLPDIRVIVYNQIPVMAMLRVPTTESDGKANMELGAIAMGIDMGTGFTTGAAKKSKYITRMPNGESAIGFEVPYWNEILHACSRIQAVTKIGFLGVDLVIAKSGVKVLEVNARPGLKIQVANKTPMRSRLKKVEDLKIKNADEAVAVTKRLFSEKAGLDTAPALQKPVIGVTEDVVLNSDNPEHFLAHISLADSVNFVREGVEIGDKLLDINVAGKRLKLPYEYGNTGEADIILSAKYLKDFFIDPSKKFDGNTSQGAVRQIDERMLRNLDEKICEIDEHIKLLAYINPRNIAEQKQLFLSHKNYEPQFIYRDLAIDTDQLRSDLKKLPVVDHVLFPLYEEKKLELETRLDLLEARSSDNFTDISERLFGGVTKGLYQSAVQYVKKHSENIVLDKSDELDLKKAMERIREYLEVHKLKHWTLKILDDSAVDIQVTKRDIILMKKGATFQENRLKALLVHEIGTHVFRFENGKRQPLRILERGTAGYLQTEEGMAVYNQNQLGLDLGDKFLTGAYLIIAVYMAQKMGFLDLYQYLRSTFDIEENLAWKLCLKSKRGFKNPNQAGAFHKDTVYYKGMREVKEFLKTGDMKDLYYGKYKISDLDLIKQVKGLKEPKFLV